MSSSRKFPVDANEAEVRSAASLRVPGPGEVVRYVLTIETKSVPADPFARDAIGDASRMLESIGLVVRDCSLVIASKAVPSPESIAKTIKQSRRVADVARRSAESRAAASAAIAKLQSR